MANFSFEYIIVIVITHVLFALWLGFNSKFIYFPRFSKHLIPHAQGQYFWEF